MSEPEPSSVPRTSADALHDNARVAIPLGIALIAGVFVALGIEGELLTRLLRNEPSFVAFALGGAVVGVTAPLILSGFRPSTLRWITGISALLLVTSTCVAVYAGIRVTGTREQPGLDVSGVAIELEKHSATVTISASALSLATDDRMLLRIAVFDTATSFDQAQWACGQNPNSDIAEPTSAEVLYWGETGPTATGTAETSHVFVVDTSVYRYACALAVLNGTVEPRLSKAVLDLTTLAVTG